MGEGSTVINAACYPSQFGCEQDVKVYEYDPAKAKALLAEAGYPEGFEVDIYGYRERHVTEARSEEHTSELQSLMRISYAVFCLKKKNTTQSMSTRPHTAQKHKSTPPKP